MHSLSHFKNNIYEYLEALPTNTLDSLLLPPLARHFVMTLLFIPPTELSITKDDLKLMVKNQEEAILRFEDALEKLSKLHILIEKDGRMIMNPQFQTSHQNCLTGGGDHQSFGTPSSTHGRYIPNNIVAFLDNYAMKQWEEILHFMVGTENRNEPSKGVLNILIRSQLMKEHKGEYEITNKGFQFLLQDVNTQVWAFLLQYLELADQAYLIDKLTETQKWLLDDLINFGLAYRRKKTSSRYYPTRLATTLTSGNSAIGSTSLVGGSSSSSSSYVTTGGNESGVNDQGFIIIETNYKLYAYTESLLQISVIKLFCELQSRFANMVYANITRDSIRSALRHGITANQIISYLTSHAHPQMKKQMPLLPPTVVDQVRLWEIERNRLSIDDGYLYNDFRTQADFDMLLKYCRKLNIVLWHSEQKRMFCVTEKGHEYAKKFINKRIAQRKADVGSVNPK
ncbi:11686_t:CDS:10 [Entrophospora sp. SA101]|nr:11686_t:CDS:10 [Entrophospora sp. SA101]